MERALDHDDVEISFVHTRAFLTEIIKEIFELKIIKQCGTTYLRYNFRTIMLEIMNQLELGECETAIKETSKKFRHALSITTFD